MVLPDGEWVSSTEAGWQAWLSLLAAAATEEQLRPKAEKAVSDYVAAWNEDDDAARAALLEACWAQSGQFQDRYATLIGRDALALHIRRSRGYRPGIQLDRTQPLWMSREYGRFGWTVRILGGAVVGSGMNVVRFAPDGRIELTVGFWDPAP